MNGYLKYIIGVATLLAFVVGVVMAFDTVKTDVAVNCEKIKVIEHDTTIIKETLTQLKSNDSAIVAMLKTGDSVINVKIDRMEKNILKAIKGE